MHHKSKHPKTQTACQVDGAAPTHRWLLPVLLVAQLMVILDITAVNIALPHIATDLKMSGSTISWTITSYSLIFGSLLLFGGRAADLLGRRRMFVTGLGVFTVSSFASAMAERRDPLCCPRGPGARRRDPFPGSTFDHHQLVPGCSSRRRSPHGVQSAVRARQSASSSAASSPSSPTGGRSSTSTSPSPPFCSSLAEGCPGRHEKPRWRGLDLPGAALATTSLAAIVYGITQAHSAGWTSIQTHIWESAASRA